MIATCADTPAGRVALAHRPMCTAPIEGHEGDCVVPGPNEMPCDRCQGTGEVCYGGADAETDPPMVYACVQCKGTRLMPRPPARMPAIGSITDILAHVRPALEAGRSIEFADGPLARVRPGAAEDDDADRTGRPTEEADPFVERPFIPAKHARASFDTFDPTIAPAHRGDLAAARRAVERWTAAAIEGRPAMLAIVGSTGNGKSHLLYAAARALEAARVPQWCYPWYKLADALRYGGYLPWGMQEERVRGRRLTLARLEGWQLRERMQRARAVLVDEVTGTAGTDFDGQELKKLACHAYDEGTALLITSNVYPLAEIMGAPAADRFVVVQLTAPSRRAEL